MSKKTNWTEVIVGAAIATITTLDVVPIDEIVGVPLGAALILKGFGFI